MNHTSTKAEQVDGVKLIVVEKKFFLATDRGGRTRAPACGLEGASEAGGRLLQADEQLVGLGHVLTSANVALRRLGHRLAEEGLNVRLALSLVLTRLADGDDLVRQSVSRSVHQLAIWTEKTTTSRWKVKRGDGEASAPI